MVPERKVACDPSIGFTFGAGFITDGKLLDFNSIYPTAITSLYGVEAVLRCETSLQETQDSYSTVYGPPFIKPDTVSSSAKILRRAELVFKYENGSAQQKVTQNDLPISGNSLLASLIQFSSTRVVKSHHFELLALWYPGSPLYETKHLRILDPALGLGLRVLKLELNNDKGDGETPAESDDTTVAATLAVRASLVEFTYPKIGGRLLAGGSFFVGQFYGFVGSAALELELPMSRLIKNSKKIKK